MSEASLTHADPVQRAEHARGVAVDMVRVLRDAGHIAYFAGGCVRDELLGEHPKDYDIATDATPDRVGELFDGARFVGASFGVVQVRRKGVTVEIATFRTDGSYSDRRRPDEVTFSTPDEDAKRRDFTINAMFLDPLADADISQTQGLASVRGRVIDYVDGLACLRAGLIKAVGLAEDRLAEDHLRALRAVRFAARFAFSIETNTTKAIRDHARDLVGVSRERVGDEVLRMLAHPGRGAAVRIIHELDLVEPVLGVAGTDSQQELVAHLPSDASAITAVAAWLIQLEHIDTTVGTPMIHSTLVVGDDHEVVAQVRESLCLSNDATAGIAELCAIVRNVLSFWERMSVAQRKRLASVGLNRSSPDMPGFAGAMQIVAAMDKAAGTDVASQIETAVRLLASDGVGLSPDPLLTGDHLVAAGFVPGPAFKRALDEVYDGQLEGRVTSQQEALAMGSRML